MPKQILLIVGHGSRVPQTVEQFYQLTGALASRVDLPVSSCFLELVEPDLTTGLTTAANRVGAGGQVLVLPLFLGAAGHQKNDVAAAVQWARRHFSAVNFRYGAPLGPHAKLVELLELRVQQAFAARPQARPPQESIVLVIGRGSSDPESNSEIARTAYLLMEKRPYRSAEFAFQAVARPNVPDGLRRCAQLGAKQIVIAPYILFTGKVDEYILNVTQQAERELSLPVLAASYLGVHELVIDVVAQRAEELRAGSATMTCDLCKYRFSMAGYTHQVGTKPKPHPASAGLPDQQPDSSGPAKRVGPPHYPIALSQMAGKRVVVVGGGPVGERKVTGLRAVQARVTLISPTVTPSLQNWAEAGEIEWLRRPYQAGDLTGAYLVFAATNSRPVNAQVARDAAAHKLFCNIADAPEESNFHVPAIHRQANLTVAVSTNGTSPAQAARTRDRIAGWLQQKSSAGD